MSRFPTAAHLASWARICPGNNESAGKRKSGRTGSGNRWLRGALLEAAWAAARSRRTYLSAEYHRLAVRRGGKRAIVAVAHTILIIIYHLLGEGTVYQELGGNYFDEHDREAHPPRSQTDRASGLPSLPGCRVTTIFRGIGPGGGVLDYAKRELDLDANELDLWLYYIFS
jgi:hypothetical protein